MHHLNSLRGAARALGLGAALAAGLGGCTSFGLAGDESPLTGIHRNLRASPLGPAWRRELVDTPLSREAGEEFASAAYDARRGLLAIGSSQGWFECLRASDGVALWRHQVDGGVSGHAVFDGQRVLTGTDDGRLLALDVADGKELWSHKVQGAIVHRPLLVGELAIFVDGTNGVYAVNRVDGAWRWQYRRDPPERFALAGEGRPVVGEGRLHVGFSDGVLVTVSVQDGAVLWTRDLAPEHTKFQDVDASPVLAGGTLYAASAASGLYALDPDSGAVRWTRPQSGIVAMAEADDDLIISVDSGAVLRVDRNTGAPRWRTRFAEAKGTPGLVVQSDALLYVGLSKGPLYTLDLRTGQPLRHFRTGNGVRALPVVGNDGALFVLSNGGVLYAFRR